MKRTLVAVILLCYVSQLSWAQDIWKKKRYEVVAGFGTSQFFGDIGGYSNNENILGIKDWSLKQTRFNMNAGLRYKIFPALGAKISLTYAMFHATDERGSNEERGLEATTSAFEPLLTGEFYFIKSKMDRSYNFSKGKKMQFRKFIQSLDLYLFSGIGGLAWSVKGNDELVAEGMTDGGFTTVVPVGLGVNMLMNPDYSLGLELGGRYSFSDYIEGYTSQYSTSNDVYYFLSFTFTYRIPTSAKGLPLFMSKRKY
jgi:hypothetical protein